MIRKTQGWTPKTMAATLYVGTHGGRRMVVVAWGLHRVIWRLGIRRYASVGG